MRWAAQGMGAREGQPRPGAQSKAVGPKGARRPCGRCDTGMCGSMRNVRWSQPTPWPQADVIQSQITDQLNPQERRYLQSSTSQDGTRVAPPAATATQGSANHRTQRDGTCAQSTDSLQSQPQAGSSGAHAPSPSPRLHSGQRTAQVQAVTIRHCSPRHQGKCSRLPAGTRQPTCCTL